MRARLRDQSGFTLIEVLVASLILLVGLAGTMGMLDLANRTTDANAARDGAVALQRELVETARSLSYSELTPGRLSEDLRATATFSGSSVTGKGWTVHRGNRDYHVAVGVCIVDSSADGIGAHDASTFCLTGTGSTSAAQCRSALGTSGGIQGTATGGQVGDCGIDTNLDGEVDGLIGLPATSGTADTNPEDLKRIVTLVRWDQGTGSKFVLASSTLPYPGLSSAPSVTALTPSSSYVQSTSPYTVSASNQTILPFTATTNRAATSVGWFLDGSPVAGATDAGSGLTWNFSWNLGSVNLSATAPADGEAVDGSYKIGARAYNRYAAGGQAKVETIKLNRRPPFQPAGFEAVHVDTDVEMAWSQAVERDVEGFITYRVTSTGSKVVVCAMSRATTCTDSNPPSAGDFTYQTVALDRDPAGALREGQVASKTIPLDNRTPRPPANLQATRNGTQVALTWSASPGDTDGTVVSYRIFRDGSDVRSRYAGTSALTYTDSGAGDLTHTYCVAAVDDKAGQSACSDPATA
jgi:prepilin-type N-terminal cleavage/methylation domain-containing protein